MRMHKPVGSKERLIEMFQKVNHVKLNENLLEMGGVNLNADSVLNLAFSQLVNKKLNIEHTSTQGSGEDNFVELTCVDPEGNNITFVFKVLTSEGDQDGVYTLESAQLTAFGFDSADGEETIDLDENGLAQFNQQYADELLDVVEQYADVEEPSDAEELGEAIKLIDAIKKDSYPYGGGNDRMQTGQNYGDKKPTNDKVRVKSPQLDKFIQEEINEFDKPAMKLIQQAPGGSTAGGVKQLDEISSGLAQGAAKKAMGSYYDTTTSNPDSVDRSKVLGQARKFEGYINPEVKQQIEAMGLKVEKDSNSGTGFVIYTLGNDGKPIQVKMYKDDKGQVNYNFEASGKRQDNSVLNTNPQYKNMMKAATLLYQDLSKGQNSGLNEMDKPIFAASSVGGVVEGEFSDDISGKQAGAEIEPFRPKQFPGIYDELPVDNEPVEEVSPEKRELILKAYDNLLKTKSSPTYQEVMDEIDRITGKKKEKTRNNAIPKDFEHLEDLWEGEQDYKGADLIQAIQNVKKRLGTKFLSLGLEKYKELVKAEVDAIKQERHLSTGNAGFSMNEEEKSDYPDPIGKKFKPKKHYPKKKHKQDTTVKLGESTDQDRYEDVVFLQGDEAFQPLEILDTKGKDAALEYLKQWHNPGQHMGSQELGHGSSDKTYEKDGYIMSWNPSIGYIGLQHDMSQMNEEAEPNAQKGIEDIDNPSPSEVGDDENSEMSQLEKDNPDVYPEGWKEMDGMFMGPNSPGYGKGGEIEQLSQDKEEVGDMLQGGKADGKSPKDFDPEQILKGMKVELEHSDNPMIAIEIVMDHLAEIPTYYDYLEDMEKEAGVADVEGGEKSSDKDLTDTLLGFKPHNVGDEIEAEEDDEETEEVPEEGELGEQEDVFGRLGDILRPQKPEPEEEPEEEVSEMFSQRRDDKTRKNLENIRNVADKQKEIEKEPEEVNEDLGFSKEDLMKKIGNAASQLNYSRIPDDQLEKVLSLASKAGIGNIKQSVEAELAKRQQNTQQEMPEGLYESQVKLAKETLSNRNVPTGLSKKEATQILVKHFIK